MANDDVDYSGYSGKEPTKLQADFADWLVEKLELNFATKKEEAAWREGVRLAVALRIPFQKSPENQAERARMEAERADRPVAEKAPKAAKVVEEAPAKPAKRSKKAALPEPEEDAAEETVAVAKASKPKRAARTGAKAPF